MVSNIPHFERLIEHSRTGFGRKTYRDHLDHLIRTAMLASYLSQKCNLPRDKVTDVAIASFFHDLAYPVQEAGNHFRNVTKALGEYSILEFKAPRVSVKKEIDFLPSLSNVTNISQKDLRKFIYKKAAHGPVAAAEFLECCLKEEGYSERALEIAAAICLHDNQVDERKSKMKNKEISYVSYPLAVLLVIADELQDWGRPLAQPEKERAISIKKLMWKEEVNLECLMKYDFIDFPILDVLYSKYQNLRRLILSKMPVKIEIRMALREFNELSMDSLIGPSSIVNVTSTRGETPWQIEDNILATSDVVEFTNLPEEEVILALMNLYATQSKPTLIKSIPHNIWQYGSSQNFLIQKDKPQTFAIEILNDKYKIIMEKTNGQKVQGSLIPLQFTNDYIPQLLKSLPTVLRLKQLVESNWKPVNFPANTYWFRNNI